MGAKNENFNGDRREMRVKTVVFGSWAVFTIHQISFTR